MCVHWYFTKYFSELSYHFFSKSSGRSLDKLCVSFVKNESESNRIIVSNYVIHMVKNEALAWLLLVPLHFYTYLCKHVQNILR